MRYGDKLQIAIMLLWGAFGFGAGEAYRRGDWFDFCLAFALWVVAPVAIVIERVVGDVRWHRQWERKYGKPWRESEAAKMDREDRE